MSSLSTAKDVISKAKDSSSTIKAGIERAKCEGGGTAAATQAIGQIMNGNLFKIFREFIGNKDDPQREIDIIYHTVKGSEDTVKKMKEIKLYNEWKQSHENEMAEKIDTIVKARNYYKDAEISTDTNIENFTGSSDLFQTKFVNPEIDKDISNNINQVNLFYNTLSSNSSALFSIYNNISGVIDIIVNLIELKEKKLVDEVNKVKLYEKEYNVDVRKNLYDYERITLYDNIFNIMKIIYYSIFVIYIIFGNFMQLKLYKNVIFYIIAAIYLLLPFTLKYIFAGIIYVYEYILSIFGIHKQIYSYSDIVRASILDKVYTSPVPNQMKQKEIENAYYKEVENGY